MFLEIVNGVIKDAPLYSSVSLFFTWVYTYEIIYLYFFLGMVINSFIINFLLKSFVYFIFNRSELIFAPETYTKDCGLFSVSSNSPDENCRPVSLPSLQSQSMSFFLVFGVLHVLDNITFIDQNVISMLAIMLFSFGTSGYHLFHKCESLLDYFVGMACGGLFGFLWFLLYLNLRDGFKAYDIEK